MALPPRDHAVTLADAAAHTRRYREAKVSAVTAGAFHADQVLALLGQPGCAALRIYHGRAADGTPSLVLVGVDAGGADLTAGLVLENAWPCPPFCSAPNGLTR